LFCRNVTYSSNQYKIEDLVNNTIDLDDNLKFQKSLQDSWIDLKKTYYSNNSDNRDNGNQTQIFPSIQDTINWVIDYKQKNDIKDIFVLATGSLHLIGGIMAVLEIDVQ